MTILSHLGDERSPPDREYPFSKEDFRKIAELAYAESGILLPDSKEPLAYSRLSKRVRQLGLSCFAEYVAILENTGEVEERRMLISSLTTNTTRFSRERHHFDFLSAEVLPRLISEARKGRRVRLWSAACSSGEEAYGIAFSILEACPDAATLDIKILATDIDPQILKIAESGIYPAQSVSALPSEIAARFFHKTDESNFQVADDARSLVNFRQLNLIKRWPVKGPFDVVFCRNVAIYFDQETQSRIWEGFDSVMEPGGVLFIGHSERLSASVKERFEMVGMTTFVKVGGLTNAKNACRGEGQCH